MLEKIKKFMLESNSIEGEKRINPNDIEAVEFLLANNISEHTILHTHSLLGKYLEKDWVGKYRTCNVTVGSFHPPIHIVVGHLMRKYVTDVTKMNAWTAHNNFETIHPFRDLNGRMGRLIWLKKALEEGYDFSIPFLQAYYYQTLSN